MSTFKKNCQVFVTIIVIYVIYFAISHTFRLQESQTSLNGTYHYIAHAYPSTATVNLPAGQKFVNLGPEIDGRPTYITADRGNEIPRRIAINRPGESPHSLNVVFYLQEH